MCADLVAPIKAGLKFLVVDRKGNNLTSLTLVGADNSVVTEGVTATDTISKSYKFENGLTFAGLASEQLFSTATGSQLTSIAPISVNSAELSIYLQAK